MKHKWRKDHNGEIDFWAWEEDFHSGPVCEVCGYTVCEHCVPTWMDLDDCEGPQIITNADHIRSMSDEELATYIALDHWDCSKCPEHERLSDNPLMRGEKCDENCAKHCMDWLKQPHKEEEE